MTDEKKESKDIKGKRARNKTTDADGEKYDRRKGYWTAIDKAIVREGGVMMEWLTPERVDAELMLLNKGKKGRPFEFPPSLIMCAMLTKEDDNRSYRRCISRLEPYLRLKGIDVITYSGLHRSELRFFGSKTRDETGLSFGQRIMKEAGEILREMGITELLDPVMIMGSGVEPFYEAPQLKVTSEAQERLQEQRDREAEDVRKAMEVMVMIESLERRPISCATDGSGEGIEGPGIYLEHIWLDHQRRFIKHHVLINVQTMEVVSFSVTMEKPGDAKVMVPLVEGAVKAGADILKVRADSAYDTVSNWKAMDRMNIEFVPNLKEKFGKDPELPRRNVQLDEQNEMGRKAFHIKTDYNIRWLVEVFFSVFKRLFGEKIRSKTFERMSLVMQFKYQAYAIHRKLMIGATEGAYDRIDGCLMA